MTAAPHTPPTPGPDQSQIRVAYRALFRPGDVHEIRIPNPRDRRNGVISGYVDNEEAFLRLAAQFDGSGAEAVYATLNPVNPALLARAANRLQRNAKTLTGDLDVVCYRNLLVDVDPVRPSGISATDAERAAALATTDAITAFLGEHGWPSPVVHGSSGNGGLLVYRLADLPNTPESAAAVKAVLETLASLFDTPGVTVDTSVGNPSRLVKVVGTVAAKGDHTPDRPWRRAEGSAVEGSRPHPGVVTLEQLEDVAALGRSRGPDPPPKPPPKPPHRGGSGSGKGLDIRALLRERDIAFTEKTKPYATVLVLDRCLTSTEHDGGACIMEFSSGALGYKCQHAGCAGKSWEDAKAALGLASRRGAGSGDGAGPDPNRYQVQWDDEIEDLPPPAWLVRDYVTEQSIAVLYGPPGAGKSFVALDLALCVSRGRDWHGNATREGTVVYGASEGAAGLGQRVKAWKKHHGLAGRMGTGFVFQPCNFLHAADVDAFLGCLRALPEAPALVVVDTLAWAMAATPEERNRLARQLLSGAVVEDRTVVAVVPRPEVAPFFTLVEVPEKSGDADPGDSGSASGQGSHEKWVSAEATGVPSALLTAPSPYA